MRAVQCYLYSKYSIFHNEISRNASYPRENALRRYGQVDAAELLDGVVAILPVVGQDGDQDARLRLTGGSNRRAERLRPIVRHFEHLRRRELHAWRMRIGRMRKEGIGRRREEL